MTYIKIINGQPEAYTIGQLRRDNPNTSFPKRPDDALLAQWGMLPLTLTPPPESDYAKSFKEGPPILVNEEWTQLWQKEQLPQAEAEANIRSQRDGLLRNSDWIVSKSYELGEPVPIDWATYRQALRDITLQEGFPYNVLWPTAPQMGDL
jgi:hypothetical protein